MTKSYNILSGPLFISVLAIAFCVWTALGNDVSFCVTTGCTLYQDFSVFGISLWWFGAGAFTLLAACALLGQRYAGRILATIFLFCDICLLLLMSATAPCISCLVAALFFALCYFLFRRAESSSNRTGQQPNGHYVILWVWLLFFVINLGQVVRSQIEIWPILNESGDPKALMFFSPSCRYCIEGINILSGNVNFAFYPLADNDNDIYRVQKMSELLDKGYNLAEALGQSNDYDPPSFFSSLSPELMLLRFRLLCNKAHVFAAGSQGVPFFEYRGLPADVAKKVAERSQRSVFPPEKVNIGVEKPVDRQANEDANIIKDAELPPELGGMEQCGGAVPCP